MGQTHSASWADAGLTVASRRICTEQGSELTQSEGLRSRLLGTHARGLACFKQPGYIPASPRLCSRKVRSSFPTCSFPLVRIKTSPPFPQLGLAVSLSTAGHPGCFPVPTLWASCFKQSPFPEGAFRKSSWFDCGNALGPQTGTRAPQAWAPQCPRAQAAPESSQSNDPSSQCRARRVGAGGRRQAGPVLFILSSLHQC